MINRVREVEYHTSYESLVELFNKTDYFDSEKKKNAFTMFFDKIKDP